MMEQDKMETEELKTLKDLKEKYQEEADTYSMDDFEKILKAEAIKCLKYKIIEKPEHPTCANASQIIQNFIDFFDWTEEDLK